MSPTAASLGGTINTYNSAVRWWFEWGTSTGYGDTLPDAPISDAPDMRAHDVLGSLSGLAPGTAYHYRLVAQSAAGVTRGEDATFVTPPADAPQPPSPAEPSRALHPDLGHSVVASVTRGTVTIRRPGAARSTTLSADAVIPVGSTVDTRKGTIRIASALDTSGRTQAATFWGGVFRVQQRARTGGRVEVSLTQRATGCRSSASPRAVAAARKQPGKPVQLWGKDNHGRYQTHGRGSVATVRGTTWVTTETCAGTRTRVVSGSVAVRDLRRKRTIIVRAGHTYLAQTRA